MMRERIVKLSELVFDEELYPRFKTDWLTVYQYTEAMKSGSVFPPIVVGVWRGKKYVIDGWHRCEAVRKLGRDCIKAVIKKYKKYRDMFADAVRYNSTHGRMLSSQEKARIIQKLNQMGFSKVQISEIVKVPVEKIERFEVKVVRNVVTGKPIVLKAPVEEAVQKNPEILEKIERGEISQESLATRTQKHILRQLLELLKNDLLDVTDREIAEYLSEIYMILGEKLKVWKITTN